MEFEQIKELLKIFEKSSLNALRIRREDFFLEAEKGAEHIVREVAPKAIHHSASAEVGHVSMPHIAEPAAAAAKSGELVTSPMVGTFYKAASPDSPAYAKVGDMVKKGQPLAIIEAMKIMNELEAEFDCKILEVLGHDGQPVEYDMPLFRVERV